MSEAYDPFAGIPNAGGEDDAKMAEAFGPLPKPTGTWTGAFSPADQYDIAEVTAKAGRYLAAAHHAGLPEPRYITISAGEIDGTPHSEIGFQFSVAAKVRAWADHFGAEVTPGTHTGPIALLPGPAVWHRVTVYCPAEVPPQRCLNCGARKGESCQGWCAYKPAGLAMDTYDTPGLAAHAEAAPAGCASCGHQRGAHFREGCDADLKSGCPCRSYSAPVSMGDAETVWTDGTVGPKPNYLASSDAPMSLADVTGAACDTIKAATQ